MSYKNRKKNYGIYEAKPFRDFRELLEHSADYYGERNAIGYRDKVTDKEPKAVSYIGLRDNVRGLATALIARDLREKKLALIGECVPGWIYGFFATMSIGAVVVPLDKEYPASDLAAIMNTAKCDGVIYSPIMKEKLKEIRTGVPTLSLFISTGEPVAEGDLRMQDLIDEGKKRYAEGDNSYYDYAIDVDKMASLVFTSGTTGKGKGVMLSTRNIADNMSLGMEIFTVSDKTMMVLPSHHTFGSTINIVGHIGLGSEIYLSGGIRHILKELVEQKPKHLILVPLFLETFHKRIWATAEKGGKVKLLRTMMKISNALRKVGIDLRRVLFKSVLSAFGGELEMIISGGAPLNPDIVRDFDAFGIMVMNGYGITECSPLISCNRNEYRREGSVGIALPGTEVRLCDVNENGEGEICVRSSSVMLGYFENPEATAEAIDEEGFFHTGDLGRVELDADGVSTWIYITGRKKNLIILSNGKNVYPEEIETEIARIYGVSEVIVYEGESKSGKTDVIVAEIFPDYEALEAHGISDAEKYFNEEIIKVNGRMAPHKHVGKVKIRTEEFKKNTTRKITRFSIDKTID